MKTWFLFILRVAFALLFFATGALKLYDWKEFSETVGDFGIVPDVAVIPATLFIIFSELIGGLMLLLRPRVAACWLGGLIGVFIAAITYGIAIGLDIDCGCFGPAFQIPLAYQILIDLIILSGLVLIFILASPKQARQE